MNETEHTPVDVEILAADSSVRVRGRATAHGFETVFPGVSGHIQAKVGGEIVVEGGELRVEMASVQSGDVLRDFKTRRYLQPDRYREAHLVVRRIVLEAGADPRSLLAEPGPEVSVEVLGDLAYRGRQVPVRAAGRGTLLADGLFRAQVRFALDIRTLDMEPPRFLFLKVQPEVEVLANIFGRITRRSPFT